MAPRDQETVFLMLTRFFKRCPIIVSRTIEHWGVVYSCLRESIKYVSSRSEEKSLAHQRTVADNLGRFIQCPWLYDLVESPSKDLFVTRDDLFIETLKEVILESGLVISSSSENCEQSRSNVSKNLTEVAKLLPIIASIDASLGKEGSSISNTLAEVGKLLPIAASFEGALSEKDWLAIKRDFQRYIYAQQYGGHVIFGQDAEDLFLERLFPYPFRGVYLDIGAYHPIELSNTYLLHRRGWSGVNVEPSESGIGAFYRMRPGDRNVRVLIGKHSGEAIYYRFDEPALNTMDADRKTYLEENTKYRCVGEELIAVVTIADLIRDYLPANERVDVMNIDVENMEFEVIAGVDFSAFRPSVILVEVRFFEVEICRQIESKLLPEGYINIASTPKTKIYALQEVADRARL